MATPPYYAAQGKQTPGSQAATVHAMLKDDGATLSACANTTCSARPKGAAVDKVDTPRV